MSASGHLRHSRQPGGSDSPQAKAEAIEFLGGVFAGTTHHKARAIEQEARAIGLLGANQPLSQCRARRDARMALGLMAMREGFGKDGAWVWVRPQPMEPQQQQDEPQGEPPGESDLIFPA